MLYLQVIQKREDKIADPDEYPFCLPAVRALSVLELNAPVSFFVGENGSGKSTLLEAIAVAWGFNPEGGSQNFAFSTYDSHSPLSGALRLVKGTRRAQDGFFLRAETFYNAASYLEALDDIPAAAPPVLDSYGGSLHAKSHGESFMSLFVNRLSGQGLYILDEPEAALSVSRQLAFLRRLDELVKAGAQFLIATHSPVIMAYPGSIYAVDQGLRPISYRETDAYQLTRRFLLDYPAYMESLFRD